MAADVNETARRLADALEQAGIPYAIGGAIAYGYWGAARGTKDVDVNVFVDADVAGPALEVLAGAGVSFDRDAALESARERGDVRGFVEDVPVALFFDSIPLHQSAAARTATVEFLGRPLQILSAEDLSLFKLLFFRPKDLLDVERLAALQGDALDCGYVRRWLVDCVGDDDRRVSWWDRLVGSLTG